MLYVLLTWCYILITAFPVGFVLSELLNGNPGPGPGQSPGEKTGENPVQSLSGILMAGLSALMVYAQFFSLFSGVGMGAGLLLLACCVLCMAVWRRQMADFLGKYMRSRGRKGLAGLLLLVLFMAYGTSRGIMHMDTGLYHAQAIRWIEEYGVVPGLGNLHGRFGYNSASLALCALYSLKWLWGEPMHAVQGFLALLVAVKCAPLLSVGKRGLRVSDFLRVGTVYYLTVLYGEMVSPATDYFAMLYVFYILLSWLDLTEAGEKKTGPYAALCLLAVCAVTVKLSAAAILLLACKPAAALLKEKRWKEIGLYLGLGILIALPWLIRSVLISGWLFYPITFPDVFDVDWKIPKGSADFDAKEIQVYGRGIYDVNLYDTPFVRWAGPWFAALKGMEKLWVLGGGMGLVAGCALCIDSLRPERRAERDRYDRLVYTAVLMVCYLVWQLSAPLVRYGYAWVIALPTVTAGFWYCRLAGRDGLARKVFTAFLCLFFLYKALDLAGGILDLAGEPWYLRQQEYGDFEAFTYEIDGITVYVPTDRGQIGYDKFPSSPWIQDIELRGEGKNAGDIRYGFRLR